MASGDTIEIATNSLITPGAPIAIAQSLTLTSAAGFTGAIGSGVQAPAQIHITEAASPMTIVLDGLDLSSSRIFFSAASVSGHSLTLKNSKISYAQVSWAHSLTLDIAHNQFATNYSGVAGIDLTDTDATAGDHSIVTVDGNLIHSPNPATGYSGVTLVMDGQESLTAYIQNNILYQVGGCSCGASSALEFEVTDTGSSDIYIDNNTVDQIPDNDNNDLYISGAPLTGPLSFHIFNNSFSNDPAGYDFPAAHPSLLIAYDYNNYYAITTQTLGGYSAGNGTHDTLVNPMFINGAGFDYRLAAGSTLFGSGRTGAPGLPTLDFYGHPRVEDGVVDIGAIQHSADLSVTAAGTATASINGGVSYSVVVTDEGPYDQTNAVATLTLSAGLQLQTAHASQGSCTGTGPVSCALGDVTAGSAVDVTVTAVAETLGSQSLLGSVAGDLPDGLPANNAAVASTDVVVDAGPVFDAGTVSDGGAHADGGAETGGSGGCSCATSTGAPLWAAALLACVLAVRRRPGRA